MSDMTLNIEGMTCMGCVKSVEQMLGALPGVDRAQVSLERKQAYIQYNEAEVSPQALTEAVERAGFEVIS